MNYKVRALLFLMMYSSIVNTMEKKETHSGSDIVPVQISNFKKEYAKSRDFKQQIDKQIASYVQEQGLTAEVQSAKKRAISSVLQGLDFLQNKSDQSKRDAEIFDYALWYYLPETEEVLNEGSVDFKCDQISEKVMKQPPVIEITEFAGLHPLGGLRAQSSYTVPLYGILKFIGQYTKKREDFDTCIKTVLAIKDKTSGYLSTADEILFLMNMNRNFPDVYTFARPAQTLFHKKKDFRRSIYQPNPKQEREWSEAKIRFGRALPSISGIGARVLILKKLIDTTYYCNACNIDEIVSAWRPDEALGVTNYCDMSQVEQLAAEIMSRTIEVVDDVNEQISRAATEIVTGLELQDSKELIDIVSDALIYVKDDKLESLDVDCATKKLAFEKIFLKGIVPADSDMAHYTIRRAVVYGCVWALEFLIKNGVPVNPPMYQKWRQWIFQEDVKSPLKLALEKKHDACADILRKAGAI